MAMVDTFLTNMYGGSRADFVYTVTRDFVRNCRTPILVLPDDVPGHPYVVAMETVHLAPNAQVSLYPWKDTPDKIPLAVRHIRTFLRAHRLLQQRNLWQPPPSSARHFVRGLSRVGTRSPPGLTSGKADKAFSDPVAIEWIDQSETYGEERWNMLGMCEGVILRVTYTERSERIRIISARRAERHEQDNYYRQNAP